MLSIHIFSCEHLFQTITVEVQVPTIPTEYIAKAQKQWIIYYIGNKNTVSHTTATLNGSITIELQKIQNMPLLACVEYEGMHLQKQQKHIHSTLFYCPLSAGATAPYDMVENKIMLEFTSKAQSSELLLFLYARKVTAELLNNKKLLSTIEKKSPHAPIEKLEIIQDIADNTFNYWSVKAKKSIKLSLSPHTMNLISTSLWIPHITPETKEISLFFPGTWYFIDKHNSTPYYITLSLRETLLSNLPIQLLKMKQ